jgi:DNA-binding HxlR family transcriptional regulator
MVIAVNFERLLEIEHLLRSEWKNVIVLVLDEEGPVGFADLQRAIGQYAGRQLSDTKLNKTLRQLRGEAHVYREIGVDGRPYWDVTPDGRVRARILTDFGRVFASGGNRTDEPDGEPPTD